MTSRDFRGIPSIQEVECWGGNLNSEVKLISLQLFKLPESTVLASLNVITNSCLTFSEFSSCRIHSTNTHRSLLRMLVHDLEEGDSREYGCTANTVNQLGNSIYENWKLILRRNSKCKTVPAKYSFAVSVVKHLFVACLFSVRLAVSITFIFSVFLKYFLCGCSSDLYIILIRKVADRRLVFLFFFGVSACRSKGEKYW